MEGKVKFFNGSKGFGFVISDGDEKEYFVHITGLALGVRLNENDRVTFDVEDGERGPKAVNVKLASQKASKKEQPAQEEDDFSDDDDDSSDDDEDR